MLLVGWWSAAWGGELPGAILRTADRLDLGVDRMAVSPDGVQVLVFGDDKAVLLGPQGDPVATVDVDKIQLGDISKSGRFVLVHSGGVTVHGNAGREIGRLAAFGKVHDLALSPDGRFLALATTLSSSVYDAVDGRTLWSNDAEATRVAYDADGKLFVERGGAVVQVDAMSGAKRGAGAAIPEPPGVLDGGCVRLTDGDFCPSGPGAFGVQRPDGSLWLINDGKLDRWRPIPEDGVASVGDDGGAAIVGLAWIAATDVLVARVDGHLEHRSIGGTIVSDLVIPDCSPCDPLAVGGETLNGMWAVAQNGTWMTWDPAGAPTQKMARKAEIVAVKRLPDGRWVSLGIDGKTRVGSSPGKGGATKPFPGAIGLDVAGDTIAVWSKESVQVYSADRKPLATPGLGVGRKPVSVAVSPDGGTVAVLDDGGALHAYRTQDGRAVFRVTAGISGTQLAWAPGSGFVMVGGDPMRMFSAADGKEVLEMRLAPDGPVERLATAPDGTLLVAHTNQSRQVLRRIPWSTVAP